MFNGKSLRKWIKENYSIHTSGEQGELLSFEPKKVKFTIFLKGATSVWHQSISCNSSLWNAPLWESHDPASNLCCFCLSKTHTEIKPTCAFWMHCGLFSNQMEPQAPSKWGFDWESPLHFSGKCRTVNTELFGGLGSLSWLSGRKLRSFDRQAVVNFSFYSLSVLLQLKKKKKIFYCHFICFQ